MLWYSLEAPRRGTSNEYPQHKFSSRNKKNIMWIPPLICSYAASKVAAMIMYGKIINRFFSETATCIELKLHVKYPQDFFSRLFVQLSWYCLCTTLGARSSRLEKILGTGIQDGYHDQRSETSKWLLFQNYKAYWTRCISSISGTTAVKCMNILIIQRTRCIMIMYGKIFSNNKTFSPKLQGCITYDPSVRFVKNTGNQNLRCCPCPYTVKSFRWLFLRNCAVSWAQNVLRGTFGTGQDFSDLQKLLGTSIQDGYHDHDGHHDNIRFSNNFSKTTETICYFGRNFA